MRDGSGERVLCTGDGWDGDDGGTVNIGAGIIIPIPSLSKRTFFPTDQTVPTLKISGGRAHECHFGRG